MKYHENTCVLPQGSQFVIRMALGPHGGRVISTINQWLRHNGTEWTVNRLKSLRTAALQLRAGNHKVATEIFQANSIAYRHGTLIPRGPWGSVFTLFLKAERPAVLRRIESVLRVYTSLKLTDVSQKQADKARLAITTPFQGSDTMLDEITNMVCQYAEETLVPVLTKSGMVTREGKPRLRRPNLQRLKGFTGTHSSPAVTLSRDLRTTPYGKAALSLVSTTVWPRAFRTDPEDDLVGLYPYEIFDFIRSIVWSKGTDNEFAGHITFIQERGAKARVVAVPTAMLQWGFEPLHTWLDSVLRLMPLSCVHDHNYGAYWLCQRLVEGETLYSYDLSSATDRFPRSVQLKLLETLNLGAYAEALDEICNESWRVSSGPYKGESWTYAVGQPMGLYGSFPLFTLTHLCLLEALCVKCGIDSRTSPYLILGDDVVIRDLELAIEYKLTLEWLGLEVSSQKSVISKRVAEFAGFVAYRTRQSATAFRPYKHGCNKYLHNPVNLIHSLGSALGRTGSSYWTQKVYEFQLTKAWRNPDLSPLIPCQDESEGVNPQMLDTNRLSNLLSAAAQIAGVTCNTWTGEAYDLWVIEDLSEVLLDKQNSDEGNVTNMIGAYNPDQLLSTPDPERDKSRTAFLAGGRDTLRTDPLMVLGHTMAESRSPQSSDEHTSPPVEGVSISEDVRSSKDAGDSQIPPEVAKLQEEADRLCGKSRISPLRLPKV